MDKASTVSITIIAAIFACSGCADNRPVASKAPGSHFSVEFRGCKEGGSIDGQKLVIKKDAMEVFRGRIEISREAPLTGEGLSISLPHDGKVSTYELTISERDIQGEIRLDPAGGELIDITIDLSSKRFTYQQSRGVGRVYE